MFALLLDFSADIFYAEIVPKVLAEVGRESSEASIRAEDAGAWALRVERLADGEGLAAKADALRRKIAHLNERYGAVRYDVVEPLFVVLCNALGSIDHPEIRTFRGEAAMKHDGIYSLWTWKKDVVVKISSLVIFSGGGGCFGRTWWTMWKVETFVHEEIVQSVQIYHGSTVTLGLSLMFLRPFLTVGVMGGIPIHFSIFTRETSNTRVLCSAVLGP